MRKPLPRRQRGLTLIEALFAFLALSIGALALLRFQPELRQHAEFARQRGEAVRLAQQEIEGLRGFATRAEFDAIATRAFTIEPDGLGSPRYALQRRVDALAWPGAKAIEVIVAWTDRQGAAQQVALATLVAGEEPALAAASLLPR
ncbi:MAG: prepilin-type N-terminal cleavage/methylation domain-containing protein [Piscinibacter sp.]|uniref:type IV pilus modification PilV family protein n=1 Tax=Piscinibacter sp. TaxID=1903157 RepID=UPI001B54E4D2|nr:prepilin-type N-terminal cleavage/methylation domain-containing protein [Piscinibacter sp.]MBP5989006.1 prepilin-type N-terminal cleavage/methylation domain-containing protein [Piscinibacter sp.]MBP6026274.1 prepilin-type N-terminal cleavage/methylation domain-containing protein [Piscinibacter sp.]HNJ83510.1 prepilin-type N-terminal cleavage/methylation domain-containing protein [Piscinibacter sp.]